MSDRCCGCGGDLSEKGRGHEFACCHVLCLECLQVFATHPLRSVCFTCASPESETVRVDPLSPKKTTTADNAKTKTKEDPSRKNHSDDIIFSKLISDDYLKSTSDPFEGRRGTASFSVLERFLRSVEEKTAEIEEGERRFEARVGAARETVARHATMCRSLIDGHERRLLRQLDDVRASVLTDSSAVLDGLRRLTERAAETLKRAKGGDHVTEEMERLFSERVAAAVRFQEVEVELNNIMPKKEEENAVGKLTFKPTEGGDSSFLLSPVLMGSMAGNSHRISGIAVLDDKIFVANEVDTVIYVFEQRGHTVSRRRRFPSLSFLRLVEPIHIPSARDLAACPRNRCLYLLDSVNELVYRVRPDDGQLLSWWPVKAPGPEGLSATASGSVLVTAERKVQEFDPSGRMIRIISSPLLASIGSRFRALIRLPRHAVELPDSAGSDGTGSGVIVVADFREDGQHVVYVTDRHSGTPSRYHGNAKPASGADGFDEPRHLAVDPASGHVMVADRRNHRVVLLDRKLEFVRDLMTSSSAGVEVVSPVRLCFDHARGHLYVGQVNGTVTIYRVLL